MTLPQPSGHGRHGKHAGEGQHRAQPIAACEQEPGRDEPAAGQQQDEGHRPADRQERQQDHRREAEKNDGARVDPADLPVAHQARPAAAAAPDVKDRALIVSTVPRGPRTRNGM